MESLSTKRKQVREKNRKKFFLVNALIQKCISSTGTVSWKYELHYNTTKEMHEIL